MMSEPSSRVVQHALWSLLNRFAGSRAGTAMARAVLLHPRLDFHPPWTPLARGGRSPVPVGDAEDPFIWRAPADRPPPVSGPLEGAPVVVKDCLEVRGAPSTSGTSTYSPPAAEDAPLVARLRAAGGDLVGTVQMTELGVNGLGAQPHHGTLDNPVSPGFLPGGSSCGTAVAVASGVARFGVGTDALGSVRIPAAFCGLVGLKPTYDRAAHAGYHTMAPSLDVPGPMARTVADVVTLWQVMAGVPARPIPPAPRPTVGILREHAGVRVSAPVRRGFEAALEALGARRVQVSAPGARRASLLAAATASCELASDPGSRLSDATPDVHLGRAFGAAITPAVQARLMEERAALRAAIVAALERCDVLAMPTSAVLAPRRSAALMRGGTPPLLLMALGAFTPLANATGLPAIAVPAGRNADGRRRSIMFLGRPGEEATLLAVAAALEATGLDR